MVNIYDYFIKLYPSLAQRKLKRYKHQFNAFAWDFFVEIHNFIIMEIDIGDGGIICLQTVTTLISSISSFNDNL